jgi:acetyl-CoA carboxylase biotin carboxylase subunit
MGNKLTAKESVASQGVPLLPGLDLSKEKLSDGEIKSRVGEIGYPVLIKAAMGGGGRGMKLVKAEEELLNLIDLARTESKAAFASDEIYIEKFCQNPRHIEIQILSDKFGNIVHLGERECSVQRRHQKILEEAPSPFLTQGLREKMGEMAIAAARAVNYATVGTVEFIVDKDRNFYFLEMNTRIQVEHPVTEMITGVDLVREQIRVAAGEKLNISQEDIKFQGHAIECRVTAEDPETFAPSPGKIDMFHPPMGRGVRLESTVYSGYVVSPYYDSMLAKLIVHDDSRELALQKLKQALSEFVVQGVKTSLPLHQRIIEDADFKAGRYDTSFLEKLTQQ